MNSLKNYLLAVLALTTLGGAYLAWQQHGELTELRTAAMNKDERAVLQKRVWDLERTNKQLNDRLASTARPGDGPDSLAAGGPPPEGRGEARPGRGPASAMQQLEAMRELMAKPEFQALLNVQQKARVDAQYAALFKNLNLTPDQTEKLKTILADRQTTLQDVASAAREQGIDPRRDPEAFKKLMDSTQADINANIKAVLGDSGFAQFETYEKTLPQRGVVNQLQQRLSQTDTPLTNTQAEQLVQILAANTPARPAGTAVTTTNQLQIALPPGAAGGPGGGAMAFTRGPDVGALGAMIGSFISGAPGAGGITLSADGRGAAVAGIAPVTPAAVTQAQTVLSTPQVAALQQIQQQQQSQQQINRLIAESMAAQRGGPGSPPPPPPARPGGG